MSNENQGKGIERADNDLIKALETTEEYKAWQESLFAIIGYTTDEELNDEELAMELMADHLNSSFGLQKGLESARDKKRKELNEEWLLDNSGQ
ncbi:MAG: hypothetical protein HZC47_05375 [Methanobacterium sp.]|uniref:hypothetical protein n=1 Tax=Methanobacterium sp. TaxID=2164 RepID=UPI003D651706|nr:hypothetical protein [Methanobacterium sp.]